MEREAVGLEPVEWVGTPHGDFPAPVLLLLLTPSSKQEHSFLLAISATSVLFKGLN